MIGKTITSVYMERLDSECKPNERGSKEGMVLTFDDGTRTTLAVDCNCCGCCYIDDAVKIVE